MAHIEDRWYRTVRHSDGRTERIKSNLFGNGLRYRVRYIAPDGRERSKSFPDKEKRAAEAFLVSIEADKLRGSYVDPQAGRITFADYATQWLASQTFDQSTREVTERRLRRHVFPYLGGRALAAIRPVHIRELDRELQRNGLSVTFRAVVYSNVATILNTAVDDERIAKNPCHARTVRPPKPDPRRVVPWTHERVIAVRSHMPERYRLAVDLGAGCGMRQGEILGLAVDDVDDDRGVVHVVRQIKTVGNRVVFALPKGRKTRDVPLADSVALAIAAHVDRWPPAAITLPWETPDGPPVTARLLIHGKRLVALDRSYFNPDVWHPALLAAGVELGRENGMHALRHFYASVLLDAGESIKALSEYLGHSDPGFTLRTYTHLMPTSENRTRKAIDLVLGGLASADGLTTA
jgi:integrase